MWYKSCLFHKANVRKYNEWQEAISIYDDKNNEKKYSSYEYFITEIVSTKSFVSPELPKTNLGKYTSNIKRRN